jgi:hypothetical protein
MHGPINVKSPNNISKWQMEFNSAFKRLNLPVISNVSETCIGASMILKKGYHPRINIVEDENGDGLPQYFVWVEKPFLSTV